MAIDKSLARNDSLIEFGLILKSSDLVFVTGSVQRVGLSDVGIPLFECALINDVGDPGGCEHTEIVAACGAYEQVFS